MTAKRPRKSASSARGARVGRSFSRDDRHGGSNGRRGSSIARQAAPARGGRGGAARGLGGDQVEGRHAVHELLAAGNRKVREVWIADGLDRSEMIDEIIDLCDDNGVSLNEVSRVRIDTLALSDAPQGVIAFAQALEEAPLEDLCKTIDGVKPFLLVFDGITDPHNLGSLIRSGECAGITGVVLPRHRSANITPTVAKVAAGAIEHVPMAVAAGVPAALSTCKEAGVWTVGLDMDGEADIHDLAVSDQPVALVLGAEGSGLSRLTKDRCDLLARIPQYGAVASLNVAAAGAVAAFQIAHQRSS